MAVTASTTLTDSGKRAGVVAASFGARFAHVHHHDEAEVVVGADDAVDGHQHGEPDQVRIHGGLEDVELAEEAGGDRQAEQRKQERASDAAATTGWRRPRPA